MIPKGKEIACDTETTGIYGWRGARAFAFSFCNHDGDTECFQWKVDPFTRMPEPNKSELRQLEDFFGDERRVKVFYNSKFDIRMLDFWGIKIGGRVEDAYFAAHILRSNELTFKLKVLAKKYLDFPDDDEKELQKSTNLGRMKGRRLGWKIATKEEFGKDAAKADYWLADPKILRKYACGDVERTILLWKMFQPLLDADPACRKFYERELRLQYETYDMETRGVRVRPNIIDSEMARAEKMGMENLEKIYLGAGQGFNPDSPVQVAELVYNKLGFPVNHYTDDKFNPKPSVDAEALQEIDHPLVRLIQEYKANKKTISNFFLKYKQTAVLDPEDGSVVVHPDLNQVGPATGRYSCRNPNLQNVANALTTRSTIPIQARTPFCPRMGYYWLSIDYSGQEVWIFADGAKERKMLDALFAGRDLHAEVADFIWGAGTVAREKKEGKKTSRAKAKMLLFGILYGMGVKGCAAFLKCTRREAEAVLERYFGFFPGIQPFMEDVIEFVRRNGYIETAWGRKVWTDPEFAYKGTNYYVQGSGADLMKESMLRLGPWLRASKWDARMVLTIHDEIMFEVKKEHMVPELVNGIADIMEDHQGHFDLPKMPVELALVNTSWDKKIEVKGGRDKFFELIESLKKEKVAV